MQSRKLLFPMTAVFTFMVTHSTWGFPLIEERKYARQIESKLRDCLSKSERTDEKVACNTRAIKKILKWHQGTFRIVPWYRKVPEIALNNLDILQPEDLITEDKK